MAKTITDRTTDAWVTESPIKYEASATSSSSYTSPQAAQRKTPASTRNRPVAGFTGRGATGRGATGRGALPSSLRARGTPDWTGVRGSITLRTLRHRTTPPGHPHVWKWARARMDCDPGRHSIAAGVRTPTRVRVTTS